MLKTLLFAVCNTVLAASCAMAAITSSGDVFPDPATIGTFDDLTIGATGSGSVTVDGASTLVHRDTIFGEAASASGFLEVVGAGSVWDPAYVRLGFEGTGELQVRDGGVVEANGMEVGSQPGGHGTVLVTGAGSILRGSAMWVGDDGVGEVLVENGGQIDNFFQTNIGYDPGGVGTAIVDGAGSRWDSGSDLIVALDGDGELTVRNGAVITSSGGSIGFYFDTTGIVTIDGAGSTWTNDRGLFVGGAGHGTLNVLAGATVTSRYGIVGDGVGEELVDTVLVDGTGSVWTMTEELTVGDGSAGRLVIRNGGAVVVGESVLINAAGVGGAVELDNGVLTAASVLTRPADLLGTGTVHTNGWLFTGNHSFDSVAELPTMLTLDDEPGQNVAAHLDWDGSGAFGVDNGTVELTSGLTLDSAFGYAGYTAGSYGHLIVRGATWDAGATNIGSFGTGVFEIREGGQVSSTFVSLGSGTGSTGEAVVNGIGSKWTIANGLAIRRGNVRIENGSLVTSGSLTLNGFADENDPVRLAISGAQMETGNIDFSVLNGRLEVTQAGTLTSGSTSIATSRDYTAIASISGPGSSWTLTGDLDVGRLGRGEVHVADGGQLHSQGVVIGSTFSVPAALNNGPVISVTGAGSSWTADGDVSLTGGRRNGRIEIGSGATVDINGNLDLTSNVTRATLAVTLTDVNLTPLTVSGTFDINRSLLDLFLAPDLQLNNGDVFKLVEAGAISEFFEKAQEGSIVTSAQGYDLVIDYHLGDVLLTAQPTTLSGPAGDYNGDGAVNAADYIVWRDSLGASGADLAADGNRNGHVDSYDFNIWITNFGVVVAGTENFNVPESSAVSMMVVFVPLAVRRIRGRLESY